MNKKIRIITWALIGVLMSFLAYNFISGELDGNTPVIANEQSKIGSPFSVSATNGNRLTDEELIGKPWIIFFGFTYCPDVCPTTLYEITQWLEELGTQSKELQALFVTVDPERDTISSMKEYLSAFDNRIIGLRPTLGELPEFAKTFKIFYKKVPNADGSDYTMDHTAAVLLFDRTGRFVSTIDYHENPETAVDKLKLLLKR